MENYFDENIIEKIIKDNETIIANLKSQKEMKIRIIDLEGPLTDNLIKIWLDENIITMENYLNTKLYSRMYPAINYTHCAYERTSKEIHTKKKRTSCLLLARRLHQYYFSYSVFK